MKSNENYKQLMNELSITENMLAQYWGNYNKSVTAYNRYVKKFPARIFLDWTGYEVLLEMLLCMEICKRLIQ